MAKYEELDAATVQARLAGMPAWDGDVDEIRATFEFDDFRGAIQFMSACVEGIDQRNHHPTWTNKFNVVEVRLTTFDIGNRVTEHDFEVAGFLDEMLRIYGADLGYVGH